MNILVIGERLLGYPRNALLLDALRELHTTTECETPGRAFWRTAGILWGGRKKYDAVLALQPTKEIILPLFMMRLFFRGKYIGDAFTSLYDTFILDRKLAGPRSVKAAYYFSLDWIFVHMADVLLFDTVEHKEYFERTFGRVNARAVIIPVAVDTEEMRAVEPKKFTHVNAPFHVFFGGFFIPLQGVEYIVRAAHILRDHKDICFTLLGSGQTKADVEELARSLDLPNLFFVGRVPYHDLLAYTKGADLALGVFGTSGKAARVIPNKVVESAALGIPVVTGKSPAAARFFEDGKNIFFANMGDPDDLARAILRAYNAEDRAKIGRGGAGVVAQHFSKTRLKHVLETIDQDDRI